MNQEQRGPATGGNQGEAEKHRTQPKNNAKTGGNQALNAALEYAAKDRPVFPCNPANKQPLTKNGFKDATTDPEQIKTWWRKHPRALIGFPTGNGLMVLDVDPPHGPESLADLEAKHGPLPATLEQRSPRGRHLFFASNDDVKISANKLGPGLDIRANGGYVIVSPSVNSEGKAYQWTNKGDPAPAPEWLVDAIREAGNRPRPTPKTGDGRPGDDFNERGDIRPVLEKHGWKFFRSAGAYERWTRPGKETGASATIYDDGSLFVFTGSAPPFESDRRYSPFAVLALLDHGGDYAAAAAALRREGYGDEPSKEPDPKKRPLLRVVDIGELLTIELPPRKFLLSPWLQSQSLSLLYAWRGVGKTHAALNIAYACACGGKWLTWEAPEAIPVLYLDGEMPAVAIQQRLAEIVAGNEKEPPAGFFRILTPDLNRDAPMPDLTTESGQQAINDAAGDAQLIVVDNLSCLARRGGKENEAESWLSVADWALQQRAAGRSVLFIHHAGKGGQQRGTSKREDILDNVVMMKHPKDYNTTDGARFEVHFEKARGLFGQDVIPFEAKLTTGPKGQEWTISTLAEALAEQITELAEAGLTQRQIAKELKVGVATVNRHLKTKPKK